MSELVKYKKLLKSKGNKFSGIATDDKGYFHGDVALQAAKARKEHSVESAKIKKDEGDVMSEAIVKTMEPIKENEDIKARKKFTDLVMKRLKRTSPRT